MLGFCRPSDQAAGQNDRKGTNELDLTLTVWINSLAGSVPILDGIMILVTGFGVPVMVLAVVLHWWGREDRRHIRFVAVQAGLSFGLGLAINQGVLLFVHRIRPYDVGATHLLVPPSLDWSFPSDHATATFAIVLAFAAQGVPLRTMALFGAAVLVCLSRVYVGLHYASDIVGGVGTAAAAALVLRGLIREDTRLIRFVTSIL